MILGISKKIESQVNNIISQNINSLLTNNKYKTLDEIKQKFN